MLKRDDIHRYFLGAMEKKVPEKSKLVEILMETLCMGKGAIYRRLRGEVPFTFNEAVEIAEKLDMSLNSLLYADSVQVDRFELTIIEYTNMNEMDYKQWEDYVSLIDTAKNDPHSEIAESSNLLPVIIYGQFDTLAKYYLFKYQYLFYSSEERIHFSDLDVPERVYRIYRSYFNATKHFAHTTLIWDYRIFRYLVTDIRYFSSINLITKADIELLREDLFALLDYIERIALTGCFKETGKPVSLYISDIYLDSDYSNIQIHDFYMSHVRTFILNSIASTDQTSFQQIKNWINSLKKSSTLITQSGAAYRADFFEKQRQLIAEL